MLTVQEKERAKQKLPAKFQQIPMFNTQEEPFWIAHWKAIPMGLG